MKIFHSFLILVAFLSLSINISAQESIFFQVVPSDYTSVPGNGSFLGPLYTGARTYQLLIHEDLLTNLVGKEIQALSWRLLPAAGSNWPPIDVTVPNYDLYLSGSVTPANRSLTDFSMNVVGTQKQVRSGSLFIPMNSYPSGNSPNDWGPEITFDSLYLYTGGHLLIELRLTGTGTTNQSTDALTSTAPGFGTLFSACWGSSYTANSGSNGNFSIVRLTADDPVPVELISFSASASGKSVLLQWATATEINNSGFEVQRRTVDSEYEAVGFVAGSGSTTERRDYLFSDINVPDGKYSYRLKQIDFNGVFDFSNEIEVEVDAPAEYALEQNYPNPFNPSTTINYSIAEAGLVKIAVYNLLGQEVALVVNELKEAGQHSVSFNASALTSGAYFYTIETPQFKQTRKMLLAK